MAEVVCIEAKQMEVIRQFCELSRIVMEVHFKCQEPADCFCGANLHADMCSFQYSPQVMSFIKRAVMERLTNHKGEI